MSGRGARGRGNKTTPLSASTQALVKCTSESYIPPPPPPKKSPFPRAHPLFAISDLNKQRRHCRRGGCNCTTSSGSSLSLSANIILFFALYCIELAACVCNAYIPFLSLLSSPHTFDFSSLSPRSFPNLHTHSTVHAHTHAHGDTRLHLSRRSSHNDNETELCDVNPCAYNLFYLLYTA